MHRLAVPGPHLTGTEPVRCRPAGLSARSREVAPPAGRPGTRAGRGRRSPAGRPSADRWWGRSDLPSRPRWRAGHHAEPRHRTAAPRQPARTSSAVRPRARARAPRGLRPPRRRSPPRPWAPAPAGLLRRRGRPRGARATTGAQVGGTGGPPQGSGSAATPRAADWPRPARSHLGTPRAPRPGHQGPPGGRAERQR